MSETEGLEAWIMRRKRKNTSKQNKTKIPGTLSQKTISQADKGDAGADSSFDKKAQGQIYLC